MSEASNYCWLVGSYECGVFFNFNGGLVCSLVVDEADILYDDEEFSKSLEAINTSAPIQLQYIHVTATLPRDVHNRLLQMYPDCVSLVGQCLHRTALGLQEVSCGL